MISITAQSAALFQRLRIRAARLAAAYSAARGPRRAGGSRVDWHSATDLWPEFTGVSSDGK